MKALVLLAGKGSRLLPLTETTPKPLLPVAGRPVLDHILERLRPLRVEELILVTGHLGEQFEAHLRASYDRPYRIVPQTRLDGTGGAVNAAREWIDSPTLIIFGDTIFDGDLTGLVDEPDRNVIWTRTVEDFWNFGIVQTDESGRMARIVEKSQVDVGRRANIGAYYIAEPTALRAGLDRVMARPPIKGEYYFTYALNDMVEHGHAFTVTDARAWYDCGDLPSMLSTNRLLLAAGGSDTPADQPGVTIVPPVAIHPSATLEDCRMGPNVSIGAGSRIAGSTISNSIVDSDCRLHNVVVRNSMIGKRQTLTEAEFEGVMVANGNSVRAPA